MWCIKFINHIIYLSNYYPTLKSNLHLIFHVDLFLLFFSQGARYTVLDKLETDEDHVIKIVFVLSGAKSRKKLKNFENESQDFYRLNKQTWIGLNFFDAWFI